MLDSDTLAQRIATAMDTAKPRRLSLSAVATEFGITPQAVAGWRKTGRIKKAHLLKLARLTGRPARYFLGEDEAGGEVEEQAFALAEDWLSLKNPMHREHVRDLVDKYLVLSENADRDAQPSKEPAMQDVAPATRK